MHLSKPFGIHGHGVFIGWFPLLSWLKDNSCRSHQVPGSGCLGLYGNVFMKKGLCRLRILQGKNRRIPEKRDGHMPRDVDRSVIGTDKCERGVVVCRKHRNNPAIIDHDRRSFVFVPPTRTQKHRAQDGEHDGTSFHSQWLVHCYCMSILVFTILPSRLLNNKLNLRLSVSLYDLENMVSR